MFHSLLLLFFSEISVVLWARILASLVSGPCDAPPWFMQRGFARVDAHADPFSELRIGGPTRMWNCGRAVDCGKQPNSNAQRYTGPLEVEA